MPSRCRDLDVRRRAAARRPPVEEGADGSAGDELALHLRVGRAHGGELRLQQRGTLGRERHRGIRAESGAVDPDDDVGPGVQGHERRAEGPGEAGRERERGASGW